MASPDLLAAACLGVGAFAAGLVDAVVGGGGLIQFPTLFAVYPQQVPATLFGTNKLASFCGTSYATWRYAGRIPVPWAVVVPAGLAALLFSFLGAHSVTLLPKEALRPLVLVLLVAVAVHTFWHKDFGALDKGHAFGRKAVALAA
ncbi:MAG TPA: sulfite exporter TauE/SafE family protein, partial [Candidatus Methylacidiphilales bacterium]